MGREQPPVTAVIQYCCDPPSQRTALVTRLLLELVSLADHTRQVMLHSYFFADLVTKVLGFG